MSSWADRLQAAVRAWEGGEPESAAALFREVAASGDPQAAPEASHLLARVLDELGDLDGAVAAYRSVVDSGHPVFGQRAALMLGTLLMQGREGGAAHRYLRIASDGADPDTAAMADGALARVLVHLGDWSAAREAAKRARERTSDPTALELVAEMVDDLGLDGPDGGVPDPGAAAEEFRRAETLLEEGSLAAAEAVLRRLLGYGDPELVSQSAFRLYSLYAHRSEFEAAREVVERAIAVGHPAHTGTARHLLGAALVSLGDHQAALREHRLAAQDPDPSVRLPALLDEARITSHLGDDGAALAILRRVADSGQAPFAVEARTCLTQMHAEAGRTADALAECRPVIADGEPEHVASVVLLLSGLLHQAEGAVRDECLALVTQAAGHPDPDIAFRARMLLAHAAIQEPLEDPAAEQALQDSDAGLERLREGDLAGARALLRRAVDSGAAPHSLHAEFALALLELGEGDTEQADELLSDVTESDDEHQSFISTVYLRLLRGPAGGRHPILRATVDHQRLGREHGVASWREAAADPDPAVAALATAMLAQLLMSLGMDLASAAEMFGEAIESGEPLALSFAAIASEVPLRQRDRTGEAAGNLRRAHADGDRLLAPWVACRLGALLVEREPGESREDDLQEARRALESALASGCAGVRERAETSLLQVVEELDDRSAICAIHERIVAAGDALQAPRNAFLLGLTRVRMDDPAAARTAFALIPQAHPEVGRSGTFARLLLDASPDAGAALAPIRELGDEDARYWMACKLAMETAHARQRAGEIAGADAALSLVLESGHPGFVQEAAGYLGALRREAGDGAGAVAAWERAVAIDPGTWIGAFALHGIGSCLRARGDLDGAAEAFRTVLDGPYEDQAEDAGRQLAEILAGTGRAGEAREVYLRVFGDAGTADLALGGRLADSGDEAEARAAFERAAGSDNGDAAARARDRLGTATPEERAWTRLHDGDREGAEAAFTELHGSAGMAALVLALYDLDLDAVRTRLERLCDDPGRAGDAHDQVRAAALELAEAGRTGDARSLFELNRGSGDPVRAGWAAHALAALAATADADAFERFTAEAADCGDPAVAGSAWNNHAIWCGRRDDDAGVIESSRKAMASGDPVSVVQAATRLGELLRERGDLDGAAAAWARGAEADDPGALFCLRELMFLLQERGDAAALAAVVERASATGDPHTVSHGLYMLAAVREKAGDIDGAVEGFRKTIGSDDPALGAAARIDLARLLRSRGEHDEGRREYEAALASGNPLAVVMAGNQLGALRADDGDYTGAAAAFAAAAGAFPHDTQNPDDPGGETSEAPPEMVDHARQALGNVLAVAHEARDAADHHAAVRALALAAQAGAAQDALDYAKEFASSQAEGGDLDAARLYYTGALEFAGHDRFIEIELCDLLAEHGQRAEARARLERLHEHDDPEVRFVAGERLMKVLRELDDQEALLAVTERRAADGDAPAQPMAQALLGLMRFERGDTGAALETMREAARSGEPAALTLLADALAVQGHKDEAREIYLRVVADGGPDHAPRAMLDLGHLLHGEDEEEAAGWLRRAAREGGPDVAGRAALWLGEFAKRRRDLDGALPWFRRVIDSGHELAGLAAAHLGELCYWRNDRDGAVRYYELTLALTEDAELVGEAGFRLGEIRYRDGDLAAARAALRPAAVSGDPAFSAQARELLVKMGGEGEY